MNTLLRLVLLMLMWAALQGSVDGGVLFTGLALAAGVLYVVRPLFPWEASGSRHVLRELRVLLSRTGWSLVLALVFIRELVASALQVASLTLQPTFRMRPGIVAYPLEVQTDREITVLANLISLTPGTLSLDVAPNRSHLFIHAISIETEDGTDVVQNIKGSLEEYVRRALGPRL